MTALEIIDEMQRLPKQEKEKLARFASSLADERRLSGSEITELVGQLLETTDPVEKAVLRESIVRGFYGGTPDA